MNFSTVPTPIGETKIVPSGFRIETLAVQHAVGAYFIFRLMRSPAVPEKVTRAFWDALVVVTATGLPSGRIEVTMSGATSWRVRVALPVAELCGSTRTVYVPETESRLGWSVPPLVPRVIVFSVEPSGFRSETLVLPVGEVPMVTPVTITPTCWPTAPVNVALAFWPGIVVVTVVGAAKVIGTTTSGGTS